MEIATRILARLWLLPTLLLAVHAALLVYSSRWQFPTRNEVAHVPAGLVCWHTGDFSLYNVNPPLWKMIATLPTLLLNPEIEKIRLPSHPGHRAEWAAARQFADDNAANYFPIMWSSRLAGMLWSVLGGYIVYRWSSQLYGRQGGLLSMLLWCFEPNVLAHAQLVTPDIPATVAGMAATYVFWLYLKAGTWSLAAATGLLLGVAQLTKFTMLILYGVWPILALVHVLDRRNSGVRAKSIYIRLLHGAMVTSLSALVINLAYGFDGSMVRLGDYKFVSRALGGEGRNSEMEACVSKAGNRFQGTWLATVPIPLPRQYVVGLDVQRRDLEGADMPPSYLAGEWRQGGWWYYYLYGLMVKVPLGMLGLVLWGLLLNISRSQWRVAWVDELTCWLPAAAIVALVSSQTGFNHHVRYVLPIAPFICVATGKLTRYFRREAILACLLVLVLLGWSIASAVAVYPHVLSYFNELAGGADEGPKRLLGSNVDWGQDLYFFKEWADCHPNARPLGLEYYHCIDFRVVGAEYGRVPLELRPGWFAIDVRSLFSPEGRMSAYQGLAPVAKAGYSIYIFYITVEDIDRIRKQQGGNDN